MCHACACRKATSAVVKDGSIRKWEKAGDELNLIVHTDSDDLCIDNGIFVQLDTGHDELEQEDGDIIGTASTYLIQVQYCGA